VDDGTKHAVVEQSSLFKRPSVTTKFVTKFSSKITGITPTIRQRALSFNVSQDEDKSIYQKNDRRVEVSTFEVREDTQE
jgi:hypothetical protein